MQTIQEIERAIGSLTTSELEELYAWMDHNCPLPIDAQLKADLNAGRLDTRIQRALAGHVAGESRSL